MARRLSPGLSIIALLVTGGRTRLAWCSARGHVSRWASRAWTRTSPTSSARLERAARAVHWSWWFQTARPPVTCYPRLVL